MSAITGIWREKVVLMMSGSENKTTWVLKRPTNLFCLLSVFLLLFFLNLFFNF